MVENKVKERRLELGMTLEQLAKESGICDKLETLLFFRYNPGSFTYTSYFINFSSI